MKGYKEKDSFKKRFDKKIMFNGFKMFTFSCKSHVQEIILLNMFGCPLKFILGISRNFWVFSYKSKYLNPIMYERENSPPPHKLF
jgi:hypothetical protein